MQQLDDLFHSAKEISEVLKCVPYQRKVGRVSQLIHSSIDCVGTPWHRIDIAIIELDQHHEGSVGNAGWPSVKVVIDCPYGLLDLTNFGVVTKWILKIPQQPFSSFQGFCEV